MSRSFHSEKKPSTTADVATSNSTQLNDDFFTLLLELKQDVSVIKRNIAPTESSASILSDSEMKKLNVQKEELSKKKDEIERLQIELQALSNSIQQTKSEIAALTPVTEDDGLNAVTNELDAIVASTEYATESILSCSEKIDSLADAISKQAGGNTSIVHNTEEIMEEVVKIYESCNFQDLTGQRITKAVNALKFVEDKVEKMISIWGEDAIAELAEKTKEKRTDDARLLNGPSAEGKSINQNEIDLLFD